MESLAALVAILLLIGLVIFLFTYILNSIFMGESFAKMGISRGKAWIPVYSLWTWFKAADLPPAIAILSVAAIFTAPNSDTQTLVNQAASLMVFICEIAFVYSAFKMAPRFGYSKWVGLLGFVAPIYFIVLWLNKSGYQKKA